MKLMLPLILRRIVGLLGILLPLILLAGTAVLDRCTTVLASISHYYYTTMGHVFVGVLYAVGLFLCLYKGDNLAEVIATRLAGICVVSVALMPTSKDISGCCAYAYSPNALFEWLHMMFAALFLLTMSITFFWMFTQGRGFVNHRIRLQNRVYRACATIIWTTLIALVALFNPDWFGKEIEQQLLLWKITYKPIFWIEWLALVATGVSWLIKGQWLLADPVYELQGSSLLGRATFE